MDVQVQFFLESFDSVDEQHESVSVTGYIRHWWVDQRLAFAQDTDMGNMCVNVLIIPSDIIWTPKLYIYNAIKQIHQNNDAMTSVHANGTVFHAIAFRGSLKCAMQYHRMPYDQHGCFMKIGRFDETTESIQVRPRHGSQEYMKQSGVGVVGDKMLSPAWFIENEQNISTPGVRTKKYWPDLEGSTDIVFLPFKFARRPGYLVRMVLVPSWLFLIVSYTGFFIDPKSAPARAAVALLPVLIMRTLQGFVFSKLPQVATCVWLTDYLLGSMIMCCYAAVHLAIVQLLLGSEEKAAENLQRLKKVEKTARNLIEESREKKTFVATLLNDYAPEVKNTDGQTTLVSYLAKKHGETATKSERLGQRTYRSYSELMMSTPNTKEAGSDPKDDDALPLLEISSDASSPRGKIRTTSVEHFDAHFALNVRRNALHSPIEQRQTTEGDLAVIRYLLSLWQREVPQSDPTATPEMLRRVMTSFNIYMTTSETANIMCTFLRDKGFDTLEDVGQVRMIFSLFMELLLDIEKYEIAAKPEWYRVPLSKAIPGSRRLDVTMQILYPVLVVLHAVISFALICVYPENPDMGLVADMNSVMRWQ